MYNPYYYKYIHSNKYNIDAMRTVTYNLSKQLWHTSQQAVIVAGSLRIRIFTVFSEFDSFLASGKH